MLKWVIIKLFKITIQEGFMSEEKDKKEEETIKSSSEKNPFFVRDVIFVDCRGYYDEQQKEEQDLK